MLLNINGLVLKQFQYRRVLYFVSLFIVMKKFVDKLDLQKALEDPNVIKKLNQAGLRGPRPLTFRCAEREPGNEVLLHREEHHDRWQRGQYRAR